MAKRKISLQSTKSNLKSIPKKVIEESKIVNNVGNNELEKDSKDSIQIDAYESSDEEVSIFIFVLYIFRIFVILLVIFH